MRGGIHRVGHVQEALPAVVHGEINVELTLFAASVTGGHKDDTVCGADAVDGGRCVLQDRYRLNFIGVHTGEVSLITGNTVHHKERSTHAADINGIVKFTGLGGTLGNANARDFTGEHVHHVLVLCDNHILVGDGRYRTGERGLLLNAVTHHHGLFQEVAVVRQDNAERGLGGRYHHILEADEAHHQFILFGRLDLEASVGPRHSAAGRTLDYDAGTDERLPALVRHRTRYGTVLGGQGEREQHHQHRQNNM